MKGMRVIRIKIETIEMETPFFLIKKTRDAVSHRPKVRQTKGSEKTIEVTNPNRKRIG